MERLQSSYRTHTCKELRKEHVGTEVTLSGWLMRKRDHGGVVFVDLRDNYGITQVIFHDEDKERIQNLRVESVLKVHGKVMAREGDLINPKLETGEIEVYCDSLEVLSESEVLPFQIAEDDNAPEATRLKNRFLELRREDLHNKILMRSSVAQAVRELLHEIHFTEFHTPILTSSSPEGARDYIVPSRVHPGRFFALPQAPQQFKQLIMMSGYDRYFQIAPCFRDEDPRADRSPGEFYQIDMEMAFVEQDQVFEANEYLFTNLFRRFSDWKVTDAPFPRYTYDDIMSRFGSDKPDMRNPLEITDVTKVFADTEFRVFKSVLAQDGNIKAIWVKRDEQPPRKFFDDIVKYFQEISGNGLAWLYFTEDEVKGSIAKFISDDEKETLRQQVTKGEQGALFFAGGREPEVLPFVARLRDRLGESLDLLEKDVYKFLWITDYPFYELDAATGKVEFSHNPFGMPQGGLEALNTKDPLDIHATQYDLVCNGLELGSGAIRNHLPEVMYRAFEIVGYSKADVDEKFGGMIRAFTYGAPPHGGIATGFERIVMLLAKESAIRNVILFPMAQTVEDLMMGAPGTLGPEQLQEAHIRVELPPEMKANKELANE